MRKATPYLLIAALFGAMAWVVVLNMIEAANRSRQKRTMVDMRDIAQALEARATDTKTYGLSPADTRKRVALGDLRPLRRVRHSELERALVPKYLKHVPRYDHWDHEFDVRVAADMYAIRSVGHDGRAEGDVYKHTLIQGYERDLVYTDGTFIQYPEGV
jgi:type II secretory pathway pseudopilin PulG